MSMPGRAGRGGRGQALYEALKAKSGALRRPGEESSEPTPSTSAGPEPVASQAPPGAPVPVGRGALLAKLAAQRATQEASPPGLPSSGTRPTTSTPALPIGRGMAAVQSLSRVAHVPAKAESREFPTKQLEQLTLQEPLPPKQPKEFRGQDGIQIPVMVNHIPVKIKEGRGVFEYAVMFNPVIDSRNVRFKLVAAQKEILGTTRIFDGSKLFLPLKFPDKDTVLVGQHPLDGTVVQLTIRYIAERELTDCVQLFNILFRRVMNALKLVEIGRHTFDPLGSIAVPKHKVEVWPGYITAVQQYEGGLMLCAETSHRVLRTQTALEIMYEAHRANPEVYRDVVFKTIVGCVILTRYNNKTYRVDDIIWDKTPMSTFTTSAGDEISFYEYYKKTYDILIKDKEQPLLLHQVKKKPIGEQGQTKLLCMVPELCYLTGLTDEMRNDFHLMKDIAAYTRLGPSARHFELKKFVENINNCSQAKEILDNWGIYFDCELTQLSGRILKEEKIIFKDAVVGAGREADWGKDMGRNKVIKAVDLRSWVVIHTRRDQINTRNFISMMLKVCPQLGIEICPPRTVELKDERNDTLVRALRESIAPDIQLAVIITPTSRDDRYSLIKKTCCCEYPVPSQVIVGKTISRQQVLRSVTQKVALQINCKLGGELWSLEIPLKSLMVCGIDSYHDASKKSSSVLGFVASMNQTLTRWFCSSTFDVAGHEIGSALQVCLGQSLEKYYDVNHTLPEKVIIFRDGVSDGQLDFVVDSEIKQIKSAFSIFGSSYQPALVVIVVQKRINTRIFSMSGPSTAAGNLNNPPPGTVVDHTVTKRYWEDFFLVSQHVRQGTVTPTHYVVIYNSSNLKPDHIQRITYKMTHLYYNWPGTIRVPAPCQYAHKLAFLVGQSIHRNPSHELRDRLFFL